jgi:pyruvate/2-oxoglutarate dehydrogenase complex dihydrolipoamide acyltransferase (E2) component
MNRKIGPYQIVDLPPARRDVPNLLDLYWWKHSVYGLLEVDVTLARQFIAEQKARTGEALSFTGYLAFCLARAVDDDKAVQAYLKGRRQLVLFDDVDVGLTVERQIGGTRAPIGHVIRRANHKTYLEIHQEIRSVQTRPAPTGKGMAPWLRVGMLLPWPLPRLFGALLRTAMRRDPTISVATMGTVGMTAIGMFGRGSFWGLTPPMHSLFLIVGSIARKPAVVNERIEPRDILNLTVGFDHDVVDGAPAARFGRRLVELIESGYGLAEVEAIPTSEPESVSQPTPVVA